MNVCWTWRTLSLLFLIFSPVFSFPLCIGRICPTCQLLLTAKDASYPAEEDDSLSGTSSRQRGRIRPLRRGNQLSTRAKELEEKSQKNIKRREIAQQDPNLLVDMLFSEVVSAPTNRALQEQMGVDRMTLVQGRIFALARDGESLLVRARVGTGKTLGFLVPAVERLVSLEPSQFQPGRDIGVVIIAPTVELCRQIADTAGDLVSFHPNMSVRAVYGGTSIQRDVRTLEQSIPSILVSTPGRLLDLAENERVRRRKMSDILGGAKMLVLDEADLLVMGFSEDIRKILSYLPRKRQTMLFSATIPKRLRKLLPEICMTTSWTQIDCIEEEGDNKLRVDETYVALNKIEDYVPAVLFLIKEFMGTSTRDGRKVMIFFPAVRMVRFFADAVRECSKDIPVWEIHSQMSQSSRRHVADSFRQAKSGLLLTSDVSARGLDYPDVDIIVQCGLPRTCALYLHRVGRTGRAGRTGEALLVLLPFEKLDALGRRKSEIKAHSSLSFEADRLSLESEQFLCARTKIKNRQLPLLKSAEGFILAFLAYYVVHKPRTMEPAAVRVFGDLLAESIGLDAVPRLPDSLDESLK